MSDLLKKAKAIAALAEGWQVFRADEYPDRPFYCAKWVNGDYLIDSTYHETAIDALASRDYAPDTSFSCGVWLGKAERQALDDAIKQYELFSKESRLLRDDYAKTLNGLRSVLSFLSGGVQLTDEERVAVEWFRSGKAWQESPCPWKCDHHICGASRPKVATLNALLIRLTGTGGNTHE